VNLILKGIESLNSSGTLIFVIPEGLLFGRRTDYLQFRKYIVEQNLLEGIVALPSGMYSSYSGVRTNLLIIKKGKQNQDFFLFAANKDEYYEEGKGRSIVLSSEKIAYKIEQRTFSKERDFVLVSKSEIQDEQYNLSVGRYTKQPLDLMLEGKTDLKYLKDILKEVKGGAIDNYEIPYVRIQDLKPELRATSFRDVKNASEYDRIYGSGLSQKAILLGKTHGSLKPTYFGGDNEILLSKNIWAFEVKEDLLIPEYLISELQSEYIQAQLGRVAQGSTNLRRYSKKDLLNLKIQTPSLKKQKEIVSRIKDVVKDGKILTKAEKPSIGYETVMKFVKHEIGNILMGPNLFIDQLETFLVKESIVMDQPMSDMPGSNSIGDRLQSAKSGLDQINYILNNMKDILDSNRDNMNIQRTELLSFFRKTLEGALSEKSNVRLYIGINEEYQSPKKIYGFIDHSQMDLLLRNFVENSCKHGFTDGEDHHIVVNISEPEDDKMLWISLINDGNPFPENFEMKDFLTLGKRTEASKGSGLGGYLTGLIVKNHGGEINLMESGKAIAPGMSNESDSVFFDGKFISTGVHLLLRIPKNINE
jgi:signal transduction histidine kinase